MFAAQVKNLEVVRGGRVILRDLNFAVPSGCIFGLLGANGAGKTTMLNVLAGLLRPRLGIVELFGAKTDEHSENKGIVALVPQETALYEDLTVRENVEFFASLYFDDKRMISSRSKEMERVFELSPYWHMPLGRVSGGFQRRTSLAAALVAAPRLLLLDEPLTGVDIPTQRLIFKYIKSLPDLTVVLATHALDLAEEYCSAAIFLHEGEKIADISMLEQNCPSLRKIYDELMMRYENKGGNC